MRSPALNTQRLFAMADALEVILAGDGTGRWRRREDYQGALDWCRYQLVKRGAVR